MQPGVQFSLEQLAIMFDGDVPDRVRFGLAIAQTHARRLELIESAIDYAIQELAQTRHHRLSDGEDRITVDIVSMLKPMGIQASHDTDVGGHCDIVIRGKDNFLWLAEAKIHGAYDWDFKGFQQLSTRYSTGLTGQDHGGLILYCRGQDVAEVMRKWTDHVKEKIPELTISDCPSSPLNRRSVHTHPASGLPFHIRHTPVCLFFAPQDKP